MRGFAIIFSIYFFALSVAPCNDLKFCNKDVAEISHVSSDSHCPNHNEESDFCSPFCICTCCGHTALSFIQTPIFENTTFKIIGKVPVHSIDFISEVYVNIWQPPKLS